MRDVVVGLDGSPESRRALRWGAAFARAAGVPLRAVEAWTYPALSVLPGQGTPASPEEMDERTRADIRDVLTEELGEVGGYAEAQALRGSPAGAILQTVAPDSLLVLGARGRGGFVGLLLGSVSRECVEHASCPVVIVRGEHQAEADGPLVVGKDGSASAERALRWSLDLGEALGRETVAVYAWQTTFSEVRPRLHERLREEAKAQVAGWVEGIAEGVRTIEIEGEPRSKLVEAADRLDAWLVVVGRRGTSRVRGVGIGSVTSYLIRHSPVPVAVLPPVGAAEEGTTSSAQPSG